MWKNGCCLLSCNGPTCWRMNISTDRRVQTEGKLLYTLLDAADDAGLLDGVPGTRWQETKTRVICGATYEAEAAAFYELLAELSTTGALSGSWIESRWRTLAARVAVN